MRPEPIVKVKLIALSLAGTINGLAIAQPTRQLTSMTNSHLTHCAAALWPNGELCCPYHLSANPTDNKRVGTHACRAIRRAHQPHTSGKVPSAHDALKAPLAARA